MNKKINLSFFPLLLILLILCCVLLGAGCGKSRVRESSESESETETSSEQTQTEGSGIPQTAQESEIETERSDLITLVEFLSKDGTVKITLPDSGWKVTQDADEMRVFSSGGDAMINIVHDSTQAAVNSITIQKTKEDLSSALTKQYSDEDAFDIESFESETVGDVNIYRYVVKYNREERMWTYSVTYGIVATDEAYVITGTVMDDNSILLEAVENSVDSFTLMKNEDLMNAMEQASSTLDGSSVSTSGKSNSESSSLSLYSSYEIMYAADTVNVRSGPGIDTDIIGAYSTGDQVTVTGATTNWYQVNVDGQIGYIRRDLLSSSEISATTAESSTSSSSSASSSEEASAESSTSYSYGGGVTMYASTGVNVRSQPSIGSSIEGTLYAGSAVEVVGETDNWYIVSTGTGTGYISKAYLTTVQPETTAAETTAAETTAAETTAAETTAAVTAGTISGTVSGYTATSVTIVGDDGNYYTIYTGDADISTSSGLYDGLYVSISYTTSSDGTMSASYVSE